MFIGKLKDANDGALVRAHQFHGIKNLFLFNRRFAKVGQDEQLTESVFVLNEIVGIKKNTFG